MTKICLAKERKIEREETTTIPFSQRVSNPRPLSYKTWALPMSPRAFVHVWFISSWVLVFSSGKKSSSRQIEWNKNSSFSNHFSSSSSFFQLVPETNFSSESPVFSTSTVNFSFDFFPFPLKVKALLGFDGSDRRFFIEESFLSLRLPMDFRLSTKATKSGTIVEPVKQDKTRL